MTLQVSVIGTNYMGATHAAGMAEFGHQVIGVDIDADRVKTLNAGQSHIFEVGLEPLLERHTASGRLRFTTDYAEIADWADVHFLALGTPSGPGGAADLSQLHAAVDTLAPLLTKPTLVVGKSTVPVGTAMALEERLRRLSPAGDGVEVAWNPEFLREAYAVEDTLRPDRLVFGTHSRHALDLLEEIYAIPISDRTPVVRCDIATSELIKVAANAFLATKISFINAMAQMCQAAGGDVVLLADAIGYDERIGREFLNAGLGFGGGCLPKDIAALAVRADELGVDCAERLHSLGGGDQRRSADRAGRAGDRSGWWGCRRKADRGTGGGVQARHGRHPQLPRTHRRRPAARRLAPTYASMIRRHSLPPREGFTQVASVEQALLGAEVVLHLTEWPEFRQLDPERLGKLVASKVIIDGRLKLHAPTWRNAGWKLVQIGRATTL